MSDAPIPPVPDPGDAMPDLTARRPDVVRRLIERGVPARALQALLPDWEVFIQDAAAAPDLSSLNPPGR